MINLKVNHIHSIDLLVERSIKTKIGKQETKVSYILFFLDMNISKKRSNIYTFPKKFRLLFRNLLSKS